MFVLGNNVLYVMCGDISMTAFARKVEQRGHFLCVRNHNSAKGILVEIFVFDEYNVFIFVNNNMVFIYNIDILCT